MAESTSLNSTSSGRTSADVPSGATNSDVDHAPTPLSKGRDVFFFDIDNCLYPRSRKVHDHMEVLINDFFKNHFSIPSAEAEELHQRYYKDYGLAIEGLMRHHQVDPLGFNRQVDDALPLDTILAPDPELRAFLLDIDRRRVTPWLLTNAYITHAQRVLRLLGVADCFEGITFCDYARPPPLICKPKPAMFARAEQDASAAGSQHCWFVDDSASNCRGAEARGWHTVHLLEPEDPEPPQRAATYQIRSLLELRDLFPQFFLSTQSKVDGES